tara:strand:- start:639 stop:896 length:258 start_codon:yes stop_codon:yes gene_type:complete
MTKTFILRIAEQNYFSIKVEAETIEEAKGQADDGLDQFKTFRESGDWQVISYQEEEEDDDEDGEQDEPSDQEMMAAFGTKWHDGL